MKRKITSAKYWWYYEMFNNEISLIKDGHLDLRRSAEQMIKNYGFSHEALKKALEIGVPIAYEKLCNRIKNGELHHETGELKHESEARKLIKDYGLDPKRLEEALKIGAQIAYENYLKYIKKGYLHLRDQVKAFIKKYEKYGLSPKLLEDALKEGASVAYEERLNWIKKGDLDYEIEARKLIKYYGVDPKRLEEALKIGAQVIYEDLLSLIKRGKLSYEIDARELIKAYGLDPKRLEETLKEGASVVYEKHLKQIKKR